MKVAVAPQVARTARRSPRRSVAMRAALAGVVAIVGLSACTSDPGPKKVAEDIIRAEAFRNPDLDEDCLLAELDKFDDSDLRDIESDLAADNAERNAQGDAALLAYQRSLEICS